MNLIKQIIVKGLASRGWRLERIDRPATGFYPVSRTCQIPTLSTIYERLLGKRSDGVFVEVGAYDGESFSNTSCLADAGWRGVYVEPVPEFAQRTRKRHQRNRVTVVECAIGATIGTIPLTVAGSLSSADPKSIEAYKDIEWAASSVADTREIIVKQTTLDRLLVEQGIEPGFDVLVIDTEGFEANVFAGFTLEKWIPKILIIELADYHPDLKHSWKTDADLGEMIESRGYRIAYKDSINTVFRRS